MADKVKSQKDKYLDLLTDAADNAGSKTGNALSKEAIDKLYDDLYYVDASKVPQWLAANKDNLSMIPEVASIPEFISITENPKVVEKDYGFTESDDFYKMDGPKSWMNKSIAYLQNNADKYGLSLSEYLDKVRELSTSKEQERQWEENATVKKFENVPGIGEVNIPGLTSLMLPNSFNKAAMGQEVDKGDIAFDLGLDAVDVATTMASPLKYKPARTGGNRILNVLLNERGLTPTKASRIATSSPVAATSTNIGRQAKGIYDDTQDEFSMTQATGAGLTGALGTPLVTKAAGDVMKKAAGVTGGLKPIRKAANIIEDIGNESPSDILEARMTQLNDQVARRQALDKVKFDKSRQNVGKLLKEVGAQHSDIVEGQRMIDYGENILKDYKQFEPTKSERRIYGTGSKLWRNVKTGEILTDAELENARNLIKEYKRGPDYQPTPKNVIENQYERAVRIKNMPEGDLLVNAWSEPAWLQRARNIGKGLSAGGGGRVGINISEADKKEMAKNIINSTEWAKYVTGLPNNLTEEQIYIATVYGE